MESVSLLDALLLLRAVPDRPWSADEVGRALVTSANLARQQLEHLRAHGLATERDGAYSYDPGTEGENIDELAECYARRRHTVIGLILSPTNRSATKLADAFRLRRRED